LNLTKSSHNYCFFVHDLLVQIIKEGEKNNEFSIEIQLEEKEKKEIEKLSCNEFTEWLRNHHDGELYFLYYKQIFVALLTEYCQFLYTALYCSEKGQLSVTYALLRKPLKDNLLYLEWLVSDPKKFLTLFCSEDSCQKIEIKNVDKKTIIENAVRKIPFKIFSPDFLYDIRYNKKINFGFEELFEKANHIVTSYKFIETEIENLNFVFSTKDDKETQWNRLYVLLPGLLFYTYEICLTLYKDMATKTTINPELFKTSSIGFIISSEADKEYKQDTTGHFLRCANCKKNMKLTITRKKSLRKNLWIKCKCGNYYYPFNLRMELIQK